MGTLVGAVIGAGIVLAAGRGCGKVCNGGSLLAQAKSNTGTIQRAMNATAVKPTQRKQITMDVELGRKNMWLILLEALLAGGILVFIVWWTMFSGRKQGEHIDEE